MPAAANVRTRPRPMPLEPPVTNATLSRTSAKGVWCFLAVGAAVGLAAVRAPKVAPEATAIAAAACPRNSRRPRPDLGTGSLDSLWLIEDTPGRVHTASRSL